MLSRKYFFRRRHRGPVYPNCGSGFVHNLCTAFRFTLFSTVSFFLACLDPDPDWEPKSVDPLHCRSNPDPNTGFLYISLLRHSSSFNRPIHKANILLIPGVSLTHITYFLFSFLKSYPSLIQHPSPEVSLPSLLWLLGPSIPSPLFSPPYTAEHYRQLIVSSFTSISVRYFKDSPCALLFIGHVWAFQGVH
jgi:hypothetical protein